MTNFKIGDRVRVIDATCTNWNIKIGDTGTVIGFHNFTNAPCIEFDTFINGHDGNGDMKGKGKKGYCYYMVDDYITSITENKIVITTDGTETLARLYEGNKVIKRATAKCSPDDIFNFETGAKIAFDRLVGNKTAEEEKPKYYNGKVVCVEVKEGYAYTLGKIYEFKDGKTMNDSGYNVPLDDGIITLDDWGKNYWYCKFIPLVE